MAKILLVDDEITLAKALRVALEREGYEVAVVHDGVAALDAFAQALFDLIILDVMLPKMDGFVVCQRIRQDSTIPIIMLTAKSEDIDRVLGLEIGADDYLTKPFNTRELLARIKALLRRCQWSGADDAQILNRAALTINLPKRKVEVAGRAVDLTAKEFDLLSTLASHPGRVYSREQLMELVWGYEYLGDSRNVDVHIRRLREKVEPDPSRPQYLLTRWGAGYYFAEA